MSIYYCVQHGWNAERNSAAPCPYCAMAELRKEKDAELTCKSNVIITQQKELLALRRAVAMLNSMVLSGEQHSEQSLAEMHAAMQGRPAPEAPDAARTEFFGMKVVADPSLPPNVVEIRQGDAVVGRIGNIGLPSQTAEVRALVEAARTLIGWIDCGWPAESDSDGWNGLDKAGDELRAALAALEAKIAK